MVETPIETPMETARSPVEKKTEKLKTPKRKFKEGFNPVNNFPPEYLQKGRKGIGGRPKKTEEERKIEAEKKRIEAERKLLELDALERERAKAKRDREEMEIIEAVHRLKMRNLSVLKSLDRPEAYDDILLRTLESGARTGNPSALKFLNEILGNVPTKEQPKPSIQINILNKFS
jgi:hypothetical protein